MEISHLVELAIDGGVIGYNVCKDMNWTEVPQVIVEWRDSLVTVINSQVQNRHFLNSRR
jgi:hypothetical protein